MNGRAERGRSNAVLGRQRRNALARRLEFFCEDVAPHERLGQRWRGRNARLCEMRDGRGDIRPDDAVFEQRVDHPRQKRVADEQRAPFNPRDIGRQLGQMRGEDRLAILALLPIKDLAQSRELVVRVRIDREPDLAEQVAIVGELVTMIVPKEIVRPFAVAAREYARERADDQGPLLALCGVECHLMSNGSDTSEILLQQALRAQRQQHRLSAAVAP